MTRLVVWNRTVCVNLILLVTFLLRFWKYLKLKIYDASILATIQIAIPPPIKEITIKTLRHRKGYVKIYQIGIPIKIHQIFGKNLNTSGEQDLAG